MSREGEKPKARYIQENAKALSSGLFYPTTILVKINVLNFILEVYST